jgi:predicted transcriptional regulator
MKVLSLLLYYYDLYSGETSNIDIVWKMVFNYDTKVNIRTELDIKDQTLQNVLTRLRKKNVIKDNKILSTYIPNMEKDSTNFKIIFNFNVINEK